jgi:hypothetical protein
MKLLASLIATAALALGALVAVPSTATAAYPGTVATQTSYAVPGSVRKNRNVVVAFRVKAQGNARPSGVVSFYVYKVIKKKHHRISYRLVRLIRVGYTGAQVRFKSLGKFKKGKYVTRIAFQPSKGSVYKPSASGLRSFRVR